MIIKAIVANIVAGTILVYPRAFRLGDCVKIGEAVGDIVGKNLLVTSYCQLPPNIQDKCNQAEIEIFSTHYSGLRDGNQIAISENCWPPDYQPGTFHILSINNTLSLDKSDESKKTQS